MAAAALAVGLLTGFAGGYIVGEREAPATVVEVPAQSYTEDVVAAPPPLAPPPSGPASTESGIAPTPDRIAPPDSRIAPTRSRIAQARSATAPATGQLFVFSRPIGATVYVDERAVGVTPMSLDAVRAGAHRVRLALPGYGGWETVVHVRADASARVAASLER